MQCTEARAYLEAFADDELSPERTLDVEHHVGGCGECKAEVELSRALVAVTRSAVHEEPICPQFQEKLCRCLGTERRKQEQSEMLRPLSWRIIAPLAAAAAATLFVAYQAHSDSSPTELRTAGTADNELVDTLLSHHTRPSALAIEPSESASPEVIAQRVAEEMEPELGFRVRPPDLREFGAHFEGASMVSVNRAHAASLRYRLDSGRRVTFYVYDPEQLPLHTVRPVRTELVNNRPVFVGVRRGYSFATYERQGLGYAVTADLDSEKSVQMIAAANR